MTYNVFGGTLNLTLPAFPAKAYRATVASRTILLSFIQSACIDTKTCKKQYVHMDCFSVRGRCTFLTVCMFGLPISLLLAYICL